MSVIDRPIASKAMPASTTPAYPEPALLTSIVKQDLQARQYTIATMPTAYGHHTIAHPCFAATNALLAHCGITDKNNRHWQVHPELLVFAPGEMGAHVLDLYSFRTCASYLDNQPVQGILAMAGHNMTDDYCAMMLDRGHTIGLAASEQFRKGITPDLRGLLIYPGTCEGAVACAFPGDGRTTYQRQGMTYTGDMAAITGHSNVETIAAMLADAWLQAWDT